MPPWQNRAAEWGHRALYALILALPLTGWLFNSIVGFPLSWFGLVTLPPLAPALPAWRDASEGLHYWLGWVLIVTVVGHAAAALHHHFIVRDRTLWRMLPIVPARRLLVVALLLVPAAAQAADWTVEPGASRLGFRATQGGAPFDGAFAKWSAKIAFDPADLAGSSVTATIDVASIGTGAPDRDRELPKPDWFDLVHFPQAVFAAASFAARGGDAYSASGTLTIRDHAVPVVLPFTLKIDGDTATMDGTVEIDRTAFGVGQGDWAKSDIVGKAVTVIVHIVAKRS
jgi:polyisoprenoid-binding protein YceI